MPDPNEVGSAKIVLEVDDSGVKGAINEAKEQVKQVGDEADTANRKGGRMFRSLGQGADSLAAKLGKMTGIVGAISAATVALGAAWKAVNDYVRDGAEIAGEYLSQFDSVGDAEGSLRAIGDRLNEVNAELARLESKPFSIFGRSRKQIEEEIAALRDAQLSISRQVRQQRKLEAQEAAQAFKEEAQRLADDIAYSFLPQELQIQRQAALQREAFIKAAEEAGVAIGSAEAKRALDAINKRAEIEIEALRKADEEKRQLEQEEQRRRIEAAKREAEAFAEQLREGLNGIFSADFTTRLDSIAQALKEGNNAVRRLK